MSTLPMPPVFEGGGLTAGVVQRVRRVQVRYIKKIFRLPRLTPTKTVFRVSNVIPIDVTVSQNSVYMVWKALAPTYCGNLT